MTSQAQHQKTVPPAPELLPAVVESLLFVAGEPQEISTLAKTLGLPPKQIDKAIDALIEARHGRGVFVQRMGDRVQLATVPEAGPHIERFLEVEYGRLSRAALETLAIIAYRAPVTRATIESVRGVNSDHAVATLLQRGLIEEVGRAPGPGRPQLFAAAVRFLEYFGLQRTDDLPPLPNVELPDIETNGRHGSDTEDADAAGVVATLRDPGQENEP
jgi:segregation and condensation protein B